LETTRRTIDTGWRLQPLPDEDPDARAGRRPSEDPVLPPLPAKVPGHVHDDLMRAGVIQDPFHRMAEIGAGWVDETAWTYETTFQVDDPPPQHAYLTFHGLDTIAEITLNDAPIGRSDNMFVAHEFPAGESLRAGENRLKVSFLSAPRVGRERAQKWYDAHPGVPIGAIGERSFVRKAQYMYGWDWGPRIVSCGIWKPVELTSVPVARLLDWRCEVEFTPAGPAVLHIEAFVERSPSAHDTALTLTASLPGVGNTADGFTDPQVEPVSAAVPAGRERIAVALPLTIDDPRLWQPVGRGEPHPDSLPTLYQLDLTLRAEEVVDAKRAYIGLRTIELIREPDPDGKGESFKFRVNGEDLFAKGANWIPADSLPSRLPHTSDDAPASDRLRDLLLAARDAGMNMMRVWGGGLYESDRFYDICDQLGILVWQDFPYACAYYPDDGEYAEAARKEAVAAVRRLRTHPSLALWCGNNENSSLHHDGWFRKRTPDRYWGEKLYDEVLPQVVAEEDPVSPYWPSSPFGGDDPNSNDFGDSHCWDVWHGRGDWAHYLDHDCRFSSEFGFAASCDLHTWDLCLADEDRSPRSAVVQWHDKTLKGYDTYLGYTILHFPDPQTLDDLVYYTQLNQWEALKFGIEHWRRRMGRCWGTLFWQLQDCWPVQSWAVIDYTREPKAGYYASRRFFAPVLLSLIRRHDVVEAHLVNDLLAPIDGKVKLSILTADGEVLAEETLPARVDPNSASLIGEFALAAAQGREREAYVHGEFLPTQELPTHGLTNLMFLAEPKDLHLPDPGLRVEVEDDGKEHFLVKLSADSLAPYLWLRLTGQQQPSPLTAWEDNFFHLLPGQTRTIKLRKSDTLDTPEAVRTRLTLRWLLSAPPHLVGQVPNLPGRRRRPL